MRIRDWSFRRVLFRSTTCWAEARRSGPAPGRGAPSRGQWDQGASAKRVFAMISFLRLKDSFQPQPASLGRPHRGESDMVELIIRSEEHTSELQSLMRISYAVFCL